MKEENYFSTVISNRNLGLSLDFQFEDVSRNRFVIFVEKATKFSS